MPLSASAGRSTRTIETELLRRNVCPTSGFGDRRHLRGALVCGLAETLQSHRRWAGAWQTRESAVLLFRRHFRSSQPDLRRHGVCSVGSCHRSVQLQAGKAVCTRGAAAEALNSQSWRGVAKLYRCSGRVSARTRPSRRRLECNN